MKKSIIGLVNPKNPINVGAIIRSAGCFGVDEIFYSGQRYAKAAQYNKGHERLTHADTNNALARVGLFQADDLVAAVDANTRIVCVELVEGASALPDYQHHEHAMYVFGPEDGSIPQGVIDQADDVVYLPTEGCLNLATTVSLTLYDRMVKLGLHHQPDREIGDTLIRGSRDKNNRLKIRSK